MLFYLARPLPKLTMLNFVMVILLFKNETQIPANRPTEYNTAKKTNLGESISISFKLYMKQNRLSRPF
jgi:hypothetical protein